jgi:type VI protein secretion system component VasA
MGIHADGSRLLRHYENGLVSPADMGTEFAAEFPKIAASAGHRQRHVADPFVERLLEARLPRRRIQLKMEAEFRPSRSRCRRWSIRTTAPAPSMAIVRIRPDATLRSTPEGVELPAGLELRSLLGTEDQTNCGSALLHAPPSADRNSRGRIHRDAGRDRRRSGCPTSRTPGRRSTFACNGQHASRQAGLDRLSFFLGGPENARMRLY